MDDDFGFIANVIKWCFAMCLLGIPFFIYETTTGPYYIIKAFGFDIFVAAMVLLAFCPFIYSVYKDLSKRK